MAPEKSKMGEKVPTAAETKEDAWFDKSPFSSTPIVKLQFKQGDPLIVHRALLQRNPKLALLDTSKQDGWFYQPPYLNHISRSAGHVLVHYLYTDAYQTLNWTGPTTGRDETIAKLRTGFEVYATARRFELDRLEELTKEQILLLSKEIDAFTIVDVVSEVYPTLTDKDTWFPTYMKAVIKTAFEGSEALSKSESSENEREDDIPIAKTLLRGAVEVYREMVKTLAVKDVGVTLEKPVPVPEPSQPEDENTWGVETAKKDKKKAKCAVELEPEPEPDAEPALMPEPSQQEDDVWEDITTKKGKKDKKKKGTVAPEPEPEPELALMPEAILEPEDNDIWGFRTVKKSKKDKKKKKCAVKPKPVPEPEPAPIPELTPEPAKEDNTTASNTTGAWGLFGVTSTTSTPFGTTNNAAVGGPPGTASPAFTPTTDKEAYHPYQVNHFQSILFMGAYKGWSSEELRLADYSQGNKQGSAGAGTGAFGAFPFRKTGLGSTK